MYGRKYIHRVAAPLTAVTALAFFAGSVHAANSRPAGLTKAEYRALTLRSDGLNRGYGLASATYRPGTIGWQEYRALVLRSRALTAKYASVEIRRPVGFRDGRPDRYQLQRGAIAAATASSVDVGFRWSDAGVGALAGFALALAAGGAMLAALGRRRVAHP